MHVSAMEDLPMKYFSKPYCTEIHRVGDVVGDLALSFGFFGRSPRTALLIRLEAGTTDKHDGDLLMVEDHTKFSSHKDFTLWSSAL